MIFRIILLTVLCGTSLFSQENVFLANVETKITQELKNYQKRRRLTSLSFSFFKGNNESFEYAVGYADYAKKVKAKPGHIYTLASVTKSITAAVLLDLVQQNYLSLSDSVYKFIDSFPKDVTVKHILNHTSGFSREKENENFINNSSYRDVVDYLPVKYKNKIHRYANFNYAVVGAIIEKVTGKTYSEVANDYFHKITQNNLYFSNHKLNRKSSQFVKNYVRRYRRQLVHEPVDFGLWEPAAFAQCSAKSLARFIRFHMEPDFIKYLADNSVRIKRRTYYNGYTVKEYYALGFRLRYVNDELQYIYHDGFLYGVLSSFYYFPKRDMGFVVISNMSSYPRQTLSLGGIYKTVERVIDEAFTLEAIEYTVKNGYIKGAVFYETNKYKGRLLETMIDKHANKYLKENKNNRAINLFKLNNYAYPKSGNTYNSLGKAYMQNGYNELAIEILKLGLEINPKMKSSIKMLNSLIDE